MISIAKAQSNNGNHSVALSFILNILNFAYLTIAHKLFLQLDFDGLIYILILLEVIYTE